MDLDQGSAEWLRVCWGSPAAAARLADRPVPAAVRRPPPSTRSTRAPTRSCSRPRRPRRRSSGSWCWDARRHPGSRPRTSQDRSRARSCRRGRCRPSPTAPGSLSGSRSCAPGSQSPSHWRSGASRPGSSACGVDGLPAAGSRKPCWSGGGDRAHFRPLQKAEASSPRSAQIAPRTGRRIPGAMS